MTYTPALGTDFWFQLDLRTKYSQAFGPTLGQAQAFDAQDVFHTARKAGKYPAAIAAFAQQAIAAWKAIADVQRTTIDEFFGSDLVALRLAFEDFGQGTLLDTRAPRLANNDCIHMMDTGTSPPIGYHRWNASIRIIQTFDGDALWNALASCNALAWAIQSQARPVQSKTHANNAISASDLATIRSAWGILSQEQIDRQFDLGNGASGYHPSPTLPVA